MEILNDFSTSVIKAFDEIDPNWRYYRGLVITGTHTPHDIELMIDKIKYARENRVPFLGICAGWQLSAIEYARNVLKIKDATSEEFGEKGTFVVKKLPKLNVGLKNGESFWNNYEVDLPNWEKPEYFFITQSHPEYQSSKNKPHPLLVSFIELCKK